MEGEPGRGGHHVDDLTLAFARCGLHLGEHEGVVLLALLLLRQTHQGAGYQAFDRCRPRVVGGTE